jgi:hypothetical protein
MVARWTRWIRASAWGLTAMAVSLGASARSEAAIVVGDTVRFFDREGTTTTDSGEFGLAKLPDADTELFRTFSMQRDEFMDFHKHGFEVVGISNKVQQQNDTLDWRTAYLYTQFRNGSLSGYDYGAGRDSSANELQEAIWAIEGEVYVADGQALNWINLASEAIQDGLWSGTGAVKILNLTWATARGDHEQGQGATDVLFLDAEGPPNNEVVPEPSSLAVWSLLGFAGAAFAWRRRRKAA